MLLKKQFKNLINIISDIKDTDDVSNIMLDRIEKINKLDQIGGAFELKNFEESKYCCVCFEEGNSFFTHPIIPITAEPHLFCVNCAREINASNIKACPICRESFSTGITIPDEPWLLKYILSIGENMRIDLGLLEYPISILNEDEELHYDMELRRRLIDDSYLSVLFGSLLILYLTSFVLYSTHPIRLVISATLNLIGIILRNRRHEITALQAVAEEREIVRERTIRDREIDTEYEARGMPAVDPIDRERENGLADYYRRYHPSLTHNEIQATERRERERRVPALESEAERETIAKRRERIIREDRVIREDRAIRKIEEERDEFARRIEGLRFRSARRRERIIIENEALRQRIITEERNSGAGQNRRYLISIGLIRETPEEYEIMEEYARAEREIEEPTIDRAAPIEYEKYLNEGIVRYYKAIDSRLQEGLRPRHERDSISFAERYLREKCAFTEENERDLIARQEKRIRLAREREEKLLRLARGIEE